eukprot:TRINITY_DN44743_c0_g1_i1.p1 TRINITY_DN44743_c0_g1~~TRINITY_DN44743_c0_g1_i1.p1  ORF type:complete len:327 (-),score=81.95 TRINITY_DN44743_c0_g1_i1:85-1008(-)
MAPKMERSDPLAPNELYHAYKADGAFDEWREQQGIIHGIKYDLNDPKEREKFQKAKEMMDQEELEKSKTKAGPSDAQKAREAARARIDHWFDLYDKDCNGYLSLREFQAILVGCGMDRTKAQTLFNAADKMNKDGYLGGKKVGKSDGHVSKNEFFNWIFKGDAAENENEPKIGTAISEHAQRAITPNEALQELANAINEKSDDADFMAKMEDILNRKGLDKEGGQRLTGKDMFNIFDVNKNGTISATEFVAGLASMGWKMDNDLATSIYRLIDLEDVRTRFTDAQGKVIYQRSGFLDEKEFMTALGL